MNTTDRLGIAVIVVIAIIMFVVKCHEDRARQSTQKPKEKFHRCPQCGSRRAKLREHFGGGSICRWQSLNCDFCGCEAEREALFEQRRYINSPVPFSEWRDVRSGVEIRYDPKHFPGPT